MADQQIVFKVLLDDSGVPAAAARAGAGIKSVGAAASQQTGAFLKFAEGGKASAAQMQALSYQTTDIVTSLAGGQSPLLVLLQQGGQLKDQFGGVGNVFRAVGSVMTLGRVAAFGYAAGIAAIAYAAFEGHSEVDKLTKSLALNGYAAGVTRGQINQMAQDLANTAPASIGTAREALSSLAVTGAFVGATLTSAGRAVVAVQRLSGQSTDEIVKGFASMRGGVAKWAEESNRAYNFLTAAQYQHIRALESQGRQQDAMRYGLDLLANTMEARAVPALGYLERAIEGVKRAGSGFWDWLKDVGRPDTVQQELDKFGEKLRNFQRELSESDGSDPKRDARVSAEIESLRQRVANGQESLRRENRTAETRAADAAKNQREIEQSSSAFASARIGADAALQAKLLAQQVASGQARKIALDQDYAQFIISGQSYRDAAIAIERARSDAEVAIARKAVAAEQGRSAGSPTEALARTQAIYAAEAKLTTELAKRAQLEADILNGKLDPRARNAIEDARAAFRQTDLQNDAYQETNRYLADQREKTIALAKATSEFSFALQEQANAQALANDRDLGGRRLSDLARDQAARQAAIADQYNAGKRQLDAELRSGRLTQQAYDERLVRLRQYHEDALTAEQQYQDRRQRLEADSSVGFDRALGNYLDSARDVAGQTERLWSGVFSGMEDGIVRFATTGKFSFGDFARSVVADLLRIQIRAQLSGIFSQIGQFFGSAGATPGFGGVGAQPYAKGGVFNEPTFFKFAQGGALRDGVMGEAGPEAIMPLRRGADGSLGVVATGGGSSNQGLQLNLQVINQTGKPVEATARQTSGGGIELLLTAAQTAIAGDVGQGQGQLYSALKARFNLRD